MKKFTSFLMVLLVTLGAMAQEPNLAEDYTLVKSFTFGKSGDDLAIGTTALSFKAYETGNAKLQSIYPATAPEGIAGWMAFQGIAGSKGWTNRANYGLWSYNGSRSAAIYGEDLTLGAVVVFTCNQAATNVMTVTNGSGEADGTFTYQLSEDGKTYYCTITAEENGYVGFCGNKSQGYITSIAIYQPQNLVVPATYTIKYQDENGNKIKEDAIVNGISGDPITIANSEKQNYISGDVCYIYVSDDSDGKSIASDGTTVVTITYREAAKFNYTVNAEDGNGNILKELVSSEYFETETVSVPYNQYFFKDSALYEADRNSAGNYYNKSIKLSANNTVVSIVYDADTIDNVIYFSEAEEIEGMTPTSSGNANVRCSNALGAYNSGDPVVVTTLNPGIYTISTQIWGGNDNNKVDFKIACGGDTLVVTTTGSITTGSKEFTVNEATEVTIPKAGSANICIDWIYIQEKDPTLTTYTVKYVDEAGNELKEASVYDILPGDTASITAENKEIIIVGDKRYGYDKCDHDTIVAVPSAELNVITATFRELVKYSYTVNAVDKANNKLKVVADTSDFEGTTVTVPYNQYILVDDVLYVSPAIDKQYNKYITLASDTVVPIVYEASSIDRVVYFSEAENIEGMTATTSGNANIRCSNGTGAYNGSDDPVVVTTLTPGIYTIAAQIWGGSKNADSQVHFNIVCGGDTLVVTTTGSITTGSKEFVVNEDSQVRILRAGDRNKSIDWIYIQEKDPALTTYTVKYVDEAGNELKEASVYDILPGDTAFLKNENMEAILKGDKKYAYKSCDKDAIVAVPSAELNVIIATFRELAKYSYTVDAVDEAGNELKVIADTSDFEGTVTVPYNQYILVNDVLYVASADNQQYNKYVTLASDTAMSIVYKESSIDNVVYFSEAEDIEGMTATTSGYANVRCSDGTGAYNASDAPVVVTTLAPGAYTIAAQVWGNAGVHFNIVCGGDTLVVSTTGSITTGSKEFVVNEESQVTILRAGDRNKSIDWIYIQDRELIIADNGSDFNAVGPYSNVSYTRDIAADTYATICLPFAPDAASLENYSFFTLESVDEGILNFVEETAPVANTPYIYCLKEGKTATAITGGITVVSNELNDVVVGDWTMKGSFTNQSFDTSAADVKYYGYVSGENIVVKSDDTFAVEPYRAYFTSSVDVADMYLRIISSDDEATEITTADLDVQKPVVIYDLAGRRVEKMDKGIYIVNGKKVVK